MSAFWMGKKVLVTGGTGFIGSHLTLCLAHLGASVSVVSLEKPSCKLDIGGFKQYVEYRSGDLRDPVFANSCLRGQEIVFHFASKIAGLGYNSKHPAEMMTYNTILDLQVLEAAAYTGVKLFVYPSGALVYDEDLPVPINENASIKGNPVESCKGASWAKRTLETAIPFFLEEFGLQSLVIRFSNLFGPGDDFDPESAHLIGNLVRLIANGQAPEIWGDGSQLRSYLYVRDAVKILLGMIEAGPPSEPINLGGQDEYSVKEIVDLLIEVSGKGVQPIYKTDKPCGLNRKLLDIGKFKSLYPFQPKVSLLEGLQQTYEWYVENEMKVPTH